MVKASRSRIVLLARAGDSGWTPTPSGWQALRRSDVNSTPRYLDRRVGRDVFGQDVEGYHSSRPDYPDEVFSLLQTRCGLVPGAAVFEIGPGTGLATQRLLDLGVGSLVAIEPDQRLAEYLERSRGGPDGRLVVLNQSFEDCELAAPSFDLGFAASSFHWVDPSASLAKVIGLLKPGGGWAMFWNVFRDPADGDSFGHAVRHLFDDIDLPPSFTGDSHYSLDSTDRLRQLADAGFADPQFELLRREFLMTPAQLRALYSTFSSIRQLPADERRRRLDEIERVAQVAFEGEVRRTVLTPIYTARKP
jgi:SAM-dependent methyltransferase